MYYKVKKGRHRSWPPTIGLFYKRQSITRVVRFTPSCRYDIGSEQYDTNKLMGIGYLWHHHKDSARFGWRYYEGHIMLVAYCYVSGKRIVQDLIEVEIHERLLLKLGIANGHYTFSVKTESGYPLASKIITFSHTKRWSYPLGFYFGGNSVPDHDITIEINQHGSK